MPTKRGRGWAGTLACLIVTAAWCSPARAGEGAGFGISAFTVNTTYVRETTGGSGLGFLDEPYEFTQAGGHPQGLTATIRFSGEGPRGAGSAPSLRDIAISLPPGLVVYPRASARCPRFLAFESISVGECPPASQVGTFELTLASGEAVLGPIVDVVPEAGSAASFALEISPKLTLVQLNGRLAYGHGGYALSVDAGPLDAFEPKSIELSFWGVPAEPAHDPLRRRFCLTSNVGGGGWSCSGGGASDGEPLVPFLTLGDDCAAGAQTAFARADSWEEPGRWVSAQASVPAASGCALATFAPRLTLAPDALTADAPVGLGVRIESDQDEFVQGIATPPLRSASVTLPVGVSIDPSGAAGLQACPETGPQGIDMPTGLDAAGEPVTPAQAGEGEVLGRDGLKALTPGHCPEASAIGEASATSPLLGQALSGRVYLAEPGCGGPGRAACTEADAADGTLYRVYVELAGGEGGAQGVVVKLSGRLLASPATGQLTLRLTEAPQLPLGQLTLRLSSGPRAPLANPPSCGDAEASGVLLAWSAPGVTPQGRFVSGTPDATSSSFYEVTGCPESPGTPPALSPGFRAGTLSSQAGASTPLVVTVTRGDREQHLSSVQVRLPAGVLGDIGAVSRCEEPAAREGDCPAASRIGASLVAAGAGSTPLQLAGNVYLTGPYAGAPFGLSIVTDAQLGPFDLGEIVTRARVDVDPHTAALTIISDPLPQILLGIPLRLRQVTLDLDRPGFILTPTDCSALRVTGAVTGAQGTETNVSAPFAVGRCGSLPFHPKLSLLVRAGGSRARGAYLRVVLESGAGQANVAKLDLRLPGSVSIRGSALQRACTQARFAHDPAGCPAGSVVGYATARTPILASPLAGPVLLVARPGRQLPRLTALLQGEGVVLELIGASTVNRDDYVVSRFDEIPDVPLERLELVLPQGPRSALVPHGSLCVRAARRPRRIVPRRVSTSVRIAAHNGATIARAERVTVAGCGATGAH